MDIYIKKGKIYKILPIQEKSATFAKQEFILQETNPTDKGTFIEFIRMQCIKDSQRNKITLLDGANKGDFVVCKFTISGRKIGTKEDETFYTNLDVVDMTIINKTQDLMNVDTKSKDAKFSDLFPGLDDEDDEGPSEMPLEKEKDDLPF